MIQIFTRTMTPEVFGRRHVVGYCDTVEEAREYCRHAGEWESGWVLTRSGWRGQNGRAYEFSNVSSAYKGQRLGVDWSPQCYDIDDAASRTALGLADLDLAGAMVVRRSGKAWIYRDDAWRETRAKKYTQEAGK